LSNEIIMKIKDVKCEVYLPDLPENEAAHREMIFFAPWLVSGKIPLYILRIITDDGIEGFAFGEYYKEISALTVSQIKREIIDRDPFDREWIWQRLWHHRGRDIPWRVSLGALAAVDTALWDIAGKALGTPIYKLMGAYRDKMRVYASSYLNPSVQEYVDEALSLKQQGITAYKIHPYWQIGEKDIEVCRAVRQAVGDDMTLLFDPDGYYSREEALRVGRELGKLNFYWFETPIPDEDIEGLIMLREKLDVPILATEKVKKGMFSIPEYLLRRATDIVRCDTGMSGGITPCKKIADMCNAFDMQCEIHTFTSSGGGVPALHVECAVKNCEFYEMKWPELRYGLKEYPVLDDEGYIHVPQKPGLGIEIDWEALGKSVASY